MGLIDQAKADIEQITSNSNEFGQALSFTAPTGETATIYGLFTEHHNTLDIEGRNNNLVNTNTKFAHCSFSERLLTAREYPTRDDNGEASLINHKVRVKGKDYVIREQMPDETVGFIACKLGDYE